MQLLCVAVVAAALFCVQQCVATAIEIKPLTSTVGDSAQNAPKLAARDSLSSDRDDDAGGYQQQEDEEQSDGSHEQQQNNYGRQQEQRKPAAYQKNDDNDGRDYQHNNNKNPYGGASLQSADLAQVIPFSQNDQKTLDQIYRSSSSSSSSPYEQSQNKPNVLLMLKFAEEFDQWNPRNNNSQWEWYATNVGYPANNAAFVVNRQTQNDDDSQQLYSHKSSSSSYGGGSDNKKKKSGLDYVTLYSVPFNNWLPSDDPNVGQSYNEGFVVTKKSFTVGPTQRFLARMKFTCQVINADQHPFPASLVANAWDDPRMGNCQGPQLSDDANSVYFYISVTNRGVWALYLRNANSTALAFIAKRRIGIRPRYDAIVDAAVELDNRQKVVNYYLNGYKVWSIHALGIPPPDDGVTTVNLGQGTPQIATISAVTIAFGTAKCLDETDPNNLASLVRLVRVTGNSTYYGATDQFYDDTDLESNVLWGQGAIMKLIKLLILSAESTPARQTALPGVYGQHAPKYFAKD